MKLLRIAQVTATYPPHLTGTGLVCYHNARQLARRGHQVHVYTANAAGAPDEERLQGVHVHRLRPLIRFGNAVLLPGLLSLHEFEIIHLHFPFIGGEFTSLAGRWRRIPLVITYHQDVLLSGLTGLIEKVLRHSIGRWTLRSAQKVLFTSWDYSQHSYARKLLRGREGRIEALANGVDAQRFCPGEASPELMQKIGLNAGHQAVLLVAGLDRPHYFKGLPQFLQALSRLEPDVCGVVVGEGDLRPEYQRQAEALGLGQRLFFAGRVSKRELADYYRLAQVTVLPSITMGEAFGLVLIESLACGTPVIASNLPGVRSVVTDGLDGLLARPGDIPDLAEKIAHMLALPEAQRRAMGAAGRRKVERQYTWELAADRLEAIYRDILSESAQGAVQSL